jgi:hypothetical protein
LKVRSALLGLFMALTIVLASTTVYESGLRTTLTSTRTLTSTLTQTTTVTATSNSSSLVSGAVNQATTACIVPGVQCGTLTIASANLTLPTIAAEGSANLTLVIHDTGNTGLGYFEVYVFNGTTTPEISVTPAHVKSVVQDPASQLFYNGTTTAGSAITISFSLPSSSYHVVEGDEYSIGVVGYALIPNTASPETDIVQTATVTAAPA